MTIKDLLEQIDPYCGVLDLGRHLQIPGEGAKVQALLKAAYLKLRRLDEDHRGYEGDVTAARKAGDPQDCNSEVCPQCAILDCPLDDPDHYHHDSCPSEYFEWRDRQSKIDTKCSKCDQMVEEDRRCQVPPTCHACWMPSAVPVVRF